MKAEVVDLSGLYRTSRRGHPYRVTASNSPQLQRQGIALTPEAQGLFIGGDLYNRKAGNPKLIVMHSAIANFYDCIDPKDISNINDPEVLGKYFVSLVDGQGRPIIQVNELIDNSSASFMPHRANAVSEDVYFSSICEVVPLPSGVLNISTPSQQLTAQ
ncbi:MAG: hypothetical protein AAB462_01080 [Patescibacteria group bacterium]